MARVSFLHSNDLHGSLTPQKLPTLLRHRAEVDLYFDSGDCVKAGNLGIPLHKEKVWPMLAEAQCTASCPGNRESHLLQSLMGLKMAGARHPVVCGNIHNRVGDRVFGTFLRLTVNGLKITVIGAMVAMVTERMAARHASDLIWKPPVPYLAEKAKRLRPTCDLLIALTHIGLGKDKELAALSPDIDIILGGHSHDVLEEPLLIDGTYVCQGGSHGRYLGQYAWEDGRLEGGLVPWT